ncbi:hypothetical protein [Ruminococcus sp.]|uniref:hypothetical protein n=1 Tax=Ruminococcus sp. TaxID=41978 RepID=UPI001B6A3CA4|nr:hypothetical protein [Ruminococcus sp.]MBP5432572.1 hypothetical protein [Ruminococcus sp.]
MSELISNKFKKWEQTCNERFDRLRENEEELNRFFIELYGIGEEISQEVDEHDVTVRRADLQREIKSLLSYAVGCLFGRYSLDTEGLCFAGGKWDASLYSTVIPCSDNILELNSMDSGLAADLKKFIETVYGPDTLEENLRFIAGALDGAGSPEEDIFRYIQKGFFADHTRIYKKRPIYWQFSSGSKGAFKALMYIHRYDSDQLAVLERDYAVPRNEQLKKELRQLNKSYSISSGKERTALRRSISRHQALLLEMEGFLHRLHELAEQRIELDLDDGVKVNYEKLRDILE